MEVVVKAKTVEEAVALGAEKLGKTVDEVSYTVIDEGKKGFLGMFSSEAEVKVYCDDTCLLYTYYYNCVKTKIQCVILRYYRENLYTSTILHLARCRLEAEI